MTACSTQKSAVNKQAALETTILENDDLFRALSLEATSAGERGFLGPFTGTAMSLARGAIVGLIDRESSRTVSVYEDARSDMFFYDELSDLHPLDPTGIRFQGLEITRWQEVEGRTERAFFARLSIDDSNPNELFNNSIFRLQLDDLDLAYSESPGSRRWYKPWSWFSNKKDTINLSLIITFYASWIDDNQRIHTDAPMGRFVLSLENAPLKGTTGYSEFLAGLNDIEIAGFSYLIPRSTGFAYNEHDELEKRYGQGRFSIGIELLDSHTAKPQSTTIMRMAQ